MPSSICFGCTHYNFSGDRSMCKVCRDNITKHGEPLSYNSKEVQAYKEKLKEKMNKINPYSGFNFNTAEYLAGFYDALDKVNATLEE